MSTTSAPASGFAYRLGGSDRTVLRGGAGVFYGQTVEPQLATPRRSAFPRRPALSFRRRRPRARSGCATDFRAYAREPISDAFGAVRVGEKPYLAVSFFNPNQKAPTSYQSNIDLQHQLGSGLMVEVGYIGNEGAT